MLKKCVICNSGFFSNLDKTLACSKECEKKRLEIKYGRDKYVKGISAATVGSITELLVSADLMRKGYDIFQSVSSMCFCDFIAVKNNKVLRVEARTGYLSKTGRIIFPKKLSRKNGVVDIFGIYCRNVDGFFYKTKDYKDFFPQ